MAYTRLDLRLPAELADAAALIARQDDITPGQLVRDLLAREISRRHRARPSAAADERLVAPLRARLAPDLAHARDWQDLQHRLRAKGYALREAGGGLALHRAACGQRLCKASELGFSHGRLMQRFRAPFPGHSQTWLTAKLGVAAAADRPGDDPDVIEPYE